MKKFTVLLLAAVSAVLLVPRADASVIHYGFKTGFNFSNASVKVPEASLPAFGCLTTRVQGIYADIKLGPISIQPELLLTRRGTSAVVDEEAEGTSRLVGKLDYLELPILAKYSFQAGPVRPCVFAGPSFSYLLKARYGTEFSYSDDSGTDGGYYQDFRSYLNKTEIGAIGGIGVEYQLSRVILTLEARYRLGLTDMNKSFLSEEASFKARDLSVMVGIGF